MNIQEYKKFATEFPDISYKEFESLNDFRLSEDIIKKNKIIQTDSYNRTMTYLKGNNRKKQETYGLFLRKSNNGKYNIITGIRQKLLELLSTPVTQIELDFASDAYEAQKIKGGNSYFNKEMWQKVIDNHDGYMPISIKGVKDGTVLKPGEPSLIISGPGELVAHLEPTLLKIFYKSVVATDIHYIDQIIGEGRIVEFGKRSATNEEEHIDAMDGLIVGGGLKVTSNDAAAILYPQLKSGGTMAHRYVACMPNETESFVNAVEKTENIALLIDLVDSYSGINKAIKIKKQYRNTNKIINIRLDSGDLADQAIYALNKLKENNILDSKLDKIIVSDVSNIDDILKIEDRVTKAGYNPKDYIIYGIGGLLVAKNKTRDSVSAAYKLIKTEEGPIGKLSNDTGKQPIPGDPNIEIRNDKRYIVQEYEEIQGERLLNKIYENGKFYFEGNDFESIEMARGQVKKTFLYINYETIYSDQTAKIIKEVETKLKSNLEI